MLSNLLLEVPTGAIADTWGRKRSTQIGLLFFAASYSVYFFADTFWLYILAEVIAAFGASCISGALEAWYVDGQKAFSEAEHFDQVFAKEFKLKQLAIITGVVIGSKIGTVNIAYPWLLGTATALSALLAVTIIVKEERIAQVGKRISFSLAPMIKTMRDSIRYSLKNREIIRLQTLGFVFGASVMALNMQWPVVFQSYGYDVGSLGWLFAAVALMLALGGHIAPYFKRRYSQEVRALIFSQGLTVLGIIVAGLLIGPMVTLSFFLLQQIGRGMMRPIYQDLLNKSIEHDNRATVLSFASMVSSAGNVFGLIVSGLIAKYAGIGPAWISSGIFLGVGFTLVFWHHNKSPD
jgi:MFS family permease